jgi:putative IMPACT (imprinted ancient) family translation regulator
MTDESLIKPYLESLKARYPKSHHVAYAYTLNEGLIQKAYDDGEPKGTAGLPILEAIEQHDLTDVLVTVRRDFGGVLLGGSGLVRAYREAAHEALKKVIRLKKKTTQTVSFNLSYKEYELLKRAFEDIMLECETIFTDSVSIQGNLLTEKANELKALLSSNLSRMIDIHLGPIEIKYLPNE